MGTFGYFYSSRAVFFVTAALLAPTLFALTKIDGKEIISRAPSTPSVPTPSAPEQHKSERRSRRGYSALLIFALCTALFQFANAAMLPLVGSMVTMRSSDWATALIAACIVVPQLVVAVFSPLVGRQAARWGRRPLLLLGYGALVIRGALFTSVANPFLLVAVQVLDGISAAVLGVLVPLIITDVTRETGRLNLTQGAIGTAVGIGASLSTPFAGYLTDRFGSFMAFAGMAASAALGFLLVALLMPETRPK